MQTLSHIRVVCYHRIHSSVLHITTYEVTRNVSKFMFDCSSLGLGATYQGLGLKCRSRSSKTRAMSAFGRSFLHGMLDKAVSIDSKRIKYHNHLVVACCAISTLSWKGRTLAAMSQTFTNHTARRTACRTGPKPVISRSSIVHMNLTSCPVRIISRTLLFREFLGDLIFSQTYDATMRQPRLEIHDTR